MRKLEITKRYGGRVTVLFEPRYHQYFKEEDSPLARIPGVTSCTGIIDKSGPISWWAVNDCAIPYLQERITPGIVHNESDLIEWFREAGKEHMRKKTKAGDIGTIVHKWCSDWAIADIKRRML